MSGGQHFQHSGDGHNILNGYRPRDTGYSNEDAAVLYEDPCARFFQIKSASIGNILISFEQNVWATSTINESIFTQAFESAPFVIFLFSVNKSGCFCGYSLMKSKPGLAKGPSGVFKTNENVTYRGQSFDVEWIRIITLNFIECNELKNPLNFNKSVRIAKDGQEIDRDVGKKLCQLIEMEWKTYLNSTKRFLPPTKTLSSSQYVKMEFLKIWKMEFLKF
ncbi:YT521-B family protein [Cardiosporidium cionae]|uniref:YT521-B family protein n=1 Tax=Cardiosporidium cionae TaxID=476202 RepID=A0ABQ7J4G2_9APIC|nr:YT521-B family protein [Cardiosporidium cionae]|eukprot:KAF8817949.1 YT521-B family protein [Cardiosporidium cionae]